MTDQAPVSPSTPLSDWLSELAQPSGSPGGGAASAVLLATSAALLRMVAEYTPDDPQAAESAQRLARRRTESLDAAHTDGALSAEFGAALGLSADDGDRDSRVREAATAAAGSSVELGRVGHALLAELGLLAQISDSQLAADLAVAAEALAAGIGGASINLRADLQVARKHGSRLSDLTDFEAAVQRLAEDRSAAALISEQIAATFDR